MDRKSLLMMLVAGLLLPAVLLAQGAKPAPEAKPPAAEKLTAAEQQLADRYHHLEEVLLRMAELSAPSDPGRAALLKKAVAQSKQQLIGVQFEQLVKLLEKDQLSRAIDNQTTLGKDLQGLLELLMSENRAKRIESEKARIAQYLKQLGALIKEQKGLQSRTESADDPKSMAKPQQQLAEKTGGLARQIQANEEAGRPGGNGQAKPKPAEGSKPAPAEKSKPTPGDAKAKPANGSKPAPGAKPQPGESQSGSTPKPSPKSGPGKPGAKQPGPPKPGEDGQPQPAEEGQAQSPPEPENPARKRLQAAEQRMRRAEKRLEEAQRKEAAQEQEEALRELEMAKGELEKILRQLREEEMERVLAMLEARFLKMLKLQRDVLDGTVRLDKVPQERRDHNYEIEAGRLSSREVEIVVEADRALLVLREDGTAVAFPEALAQARQDMQQVVERLAEAKVGKVTQGVEEDIINALQEMIESLKRAQKKLQEKKRKPGPSNAQPGEQALVDILSELKMIRALQMRVNTRTERYSKLVEGEQATSTELVEALARLAERQQRIYEITRDLETGKNR
jgi:hypothetical protein